MAHIETRPTDLQADDVIGVKLFIYELGGGLIEVLAIGTAIKKRTALKTQTEQLLPQAIIRDRDTFSTNARRRPKPGPRDRRHGHGKALEIAGSFGRTSARRDPWFTKLYKTLHFSSANAHNGRPAASRFR